MKILQRLTGKRDAQGSGSVAKERLRLVLAYDRASVSPEFLDLIKDEIIAVISRHARIDAEGVQVSVSRDEAESRLVADIPLLRPGRRAG